MTMRERDENGREMGMRERELRMRERMEREDGERGEHIYGVLSGDKCAAQTMDLSRSDILHIVISRFLRKEQIRKIEREA